MPKAKQPKGLGLQLYDHQLQGLAWMLQCEHPQPPTSNADVQLWTLCTKGAGFTHAITSQVASAEELSGKDGLASGGILADDMGLGKTLQVIALILANPRTETTLVPGLRKFSAIAGTLIVCPVGVMSNWAKQIKACVKETAGLKVYTYHGDAKKAKINIAEYNVVVTSYHTLLLDYAENAKVQKKGLFKHTWRRMVLDEGHIVRNPSARISLACAAVTARSRWVLSGTPIVNNLTDLYSIVKFLRVPGGLSNQKVFESVISNPVSKGGESGTRALKALMAAICLRRLKSMPFIKLGLLEKKYLHIKTAWQDGEKDTYNTLRRNAQRTPDEYENGARGASRMNVLTALLRMRQCCDTELLLPDAVDDSKRPSTQPQITIDEDELCGICSSVTVSKKVTISPCGHRFCAECAGKFAAEEECLVCVSNLEGDMVEPSILSKDKKAGMKRKLDVDMSVTPSPKIRKILAVLERRLKSKTKGNKLVIFSSFSQFLDILEAHLRHNGIGFARVDGGMLTSRRDTELEEFNENTECKVFLSTYGAGAVGISLVAANTVILADSWWAPAVEEQAVDRVYRIGQTREVTVVRITMMNSIEERILEIQKAKKELIAEAFSDSGTGRNGIGLFELRSLLV
ncbi:hypothetical protein ABW19_dt0203594 [Dactylella cylindrospora]|nr:hypothetical protein ABW19_dt0203594 [Dactylella cylindrospora]